KSAQIREILISESAWEEMTCLFAPSLASNSSLIIPYCFEYNEAINNMIELSIITTKLNRRGTTGAER
ncbi:hypothetical protein FP378_04785, partial [Enterobacter hormaechei]|nr:hypothetical protein [Enterobacter hormaechei]